jgi:peptide/nickel transport system ATP-binding protein
MLDEPTTALDKESRDSIIAMINRLKRQMDFKVLFVTHEVLLTKELCEDIAILKNGKIIERGKSEEVLANAKEDYSKELIESNFKNRGKRV